MQANPVTHPNQAVQAAAAATGNTSSGNSATVTANDFLQLLVTEMKNQDPTATQDPNEYINQLVQVNSLEQLVSINQDLGGMATSDTSGGVVHRPQAQSTSVPAGNLSAPSTTASAWPVAHALVPSAPAPSTLLAGHTQPAHPAR